MIEALLQAERMLIHGMVDQAERIYGHAIELDPRNAIAVVGLARVALENGDERLAYDRACSALEIDPRNAAALRLEARLSEVFAARDEEVARPRFVMSQDVEPKDAGDPAPASTPSPAQTRPDTPEPSAEARPSEQFVFTRNPSMAEHQQMEEQRARSHAERPAGERQTGAQPSEEPKASADEQRPGFFRRLWGDEG
jgi:hypothetical protein